MTYAFAFRSADGTLLSGWSNGQPGVPLVLSNGLGTVPLSWPALLAPDCGYAAVGWNYRGTFGSQRPADPARVRIEDHVDDLVALMDARGLDSALVACWSIGVNIAFEMALRHPDRVSGLLAVAGVPGGTFATMGAPLHVPGPLRHPLATTSARVLRLAGRPLTWAAHHLPVDARVAWLVRHSGFMRPTARPEVLVPMLREFVRQDWGWYMQLALAAAEHAPLDVSSVGCPVHFVAGRRDVLTSVDAVVEVASRLPDAQVTVLPGSHFLTLEHPDEVAEVLDGLARRTGALAPDGAA